MTPTRLSYLLITACSATVPCLADVMYADVLAVPPTYTSQRTKITTGNTQIVALPASASLPTTHTVCSDGGGFSTYYSYEPYERVISFPQTIPLYLFTIPVSWVSSGSQYKISDTPTHTNVGEQTPGGSLNGAATGCINPRGIPADTSVTNIQLSNLNQLPPGEYTASIPTTAAWGRFLLSGSDVDNLTRYTTDQLLSYAQAGPTYNILLYKETSCVIETPQITIAHGSEPLTSAESDIATTPIRISCDSSANATMSLTSVTTSINSYPNAVTVDLGNGWDSALAVINPIDGTSNSSITFAAPVGKTEVQIKSELKRTVNAAPGALLGSAILTVTFL